MTIFSKILALFTTAACFAFLGFVMVSLIAGPNWQGETNNYSNYVFEYTPGEQPTWGVKRRSDDQAVGSASPVLPQKIVDVLKQIKQEQQDKIRLLEEGDPQKNVPGITALETQIKEIKDLLYKDIKALNQQDKRLVANLAKLRNDLETTSRSVTDTVTEIEGIYLEAERRRGDIYRLQNFVAETQTDRYRSVEHQKKLRDVWERYEGVIDRLKQRNAILRKQLQEQPYKKHEPAPPET